jgi:L-alanine-DL-glutamate epimerase-like enolase superfamily enzyme
MNLRYIPYSLELKEPFGTAHGTRTSTDGMLVALEFEGSVGYGEVFMPPYYPENQKTMMEFFELIDSAKILSTGFREDALRYLSSTTVGNRGAKAAIDIALHDLFGKLRNTSVRDSLSDGIHPIPKRDISEHRPDCSIPTSFTIGIDTISTMVRKAKEANEFEVLKIKLNGENDIAVIRAIREVTDQKLFVDANQGWTDIEPAIETAYKLVELGVGLIEQPFPTGQERKADALRKECPVPIVADEDVQSADDIKRLAGFYDGVNIKLMKAGGIAASLSMIEIAKENGLKVLLGCMTESSIGISAAAQIAHLADWCDLDGNLLIKNDTCKAVQTIEGRLVVTGEPGLGITDDSNLRKRFGIEE